MSKLRIAYKNKQEIRKESVQELSEILGKEIRERDKKEAVKFYEKYKHLIPAKPDIKGKLEGVSTSSNARKG